MARRSRLRGSVVLIVASLLLGAVWEIALAEARDVSTPIVGASTPTDEHVADRLDQVWRYLGEDVGGYTDVFGFTDDPDFYATAWNLELAHHYGIDVPELDRDRVAAWVIAALERREPDTLGRRLENGSQLMARLGMPLDPQLVLERLEPLRSGWGYSEDPGGEPSWPKAAQVTRILDQVGVDPPDSLVEELRRHLPLLAAAAVPEPGDSWEESAVWSTATRVLARDELRPFVPMLEKRLRSRVGQLTDAGCTDSWAIDGYNSAFELAEATGIALTIPNLDACFAALTEPNGYIISSLGGTQDGAYDYVTTYFAARLGRAAPPRLVDSITRTVNPRGWFRVIESVSAGTAYRGIALDHSIGRTDRDPAVRKLAEDLLARSTERLADADALRPRLDDQIDVLLLAREMDVPISGRVTKSLHALMVDPVVQGWDIGERVDLLRAATIAGAAIPDPFFASLRAELGDAPIDTSSTLSQLVVLQDARPSADTASLVAAAAEKFAIAPNVFAGVTEPTGWVDLEMTAIALYGLGRLEEDGQKALPPFTDEDGIWRLLPREVRDYSSTRVWSTFWGYVLAGRIEPKGWLP